MDAESWTTREETHAPGMRLSLIAHGATGPLARTHCPSDSTISLALRPSRIRSSGTFKTTAARDISGQLGRLVLVPAAHALDVRSDGEAPRRLLCCALTDDRLERDTGMLPSWTSGTLARCLDMRSTPLIGILERLARELETPGFASDTLVDGLGTALAVEIARAVRTEQTAIRGGLAPWQLRRIEARLEDLEGPAPSLCELAALCGIGAAISCAPIRTARAPRSVARSRCGASLWPSGFSRRAATPWPISPDGSASGAPPASRPPFAARPA